MCGRYTLTRKPENLIFRFDLKTEGAELRPRYNIAPGQNAPVIADDGGRSLRMMQWGLVPSWAKDPSSGNKMINARAETLAEKPSFKGLIGKRRCLVLADGFYEWRKEGKGKIPMRCTLRGGEPFSFAGLWDSWKKPDGGELFSFTIITTQANNLLRPIHERMPVILNKEGEEKWLDPDFKEVHKFLVPYPAEMMEFYDVSKLVNSPRNDLPQCISPLP